MQDHITIKLGEQCQSTTDYITKKEIAQRLRKTPRTVEAWMRRGYLPFLKIGRSVTFHWPTVQAHLVDKFQIGR